MGDPWPRVIFNYTHCSMLMTTLRTYFQDRTDVYVAGNMFIYYEEGNPEAVVAPDVFVVLGTAKHDRASYMLWEEPKGPDFVLEITSRSTRVTKTRDPQAWHVCLFRRARYFQYDPDARLFCAGHCKEHVWLLGATRPCS